jgi:tRNA pseudouridine38-40 synthase
MENKKSLTPKKTPRAPRPEEKNFRMVVAYSGTNYQGWQKQAAADGPDTVQEMIERAARKILKSERVIIHGSGRTDSGVHARAQTAHMRAEVDLPAEALAKAFNAHLPEDIRIVKLEECAPDFHAQLNVSAKTYRYFILNTNPGKAPTHWPFLRPYTWLVSFRLDLEAMQKALAVLEGTHDFKSFQNRGTPLEDTVREILEARLVVHDSNAKDAPPWMPSPELDARLLEIRVRGTGFLKQMVRTIVGTTVEIGRGRFEVEEMAKMLAEKDRSSAGTTAPAYGLFLDNVEY